MLGLIRSRIRFSTKRIRLSGALSNWKGSETLVFVTSIICRRNKISAKPEFGDDSKSKDGDRWLGIISFFFSNPCFWWESEHWGRGYHRQWKGTGRLLNSFDVNSKFSDPRFQKEDSIFERIRHKNVQNRVWRLLNALYIYVLQQSIHSFLHYKSVRPIVG